MMNKRSAVSRTVKAIVDVPWSALNPDANEGQSLHIFFDDDYKVRRYDLKLKCTSLNTSVP